MKQLIALALLASTAFATVVHADWGRSVVPAYGFSADFPGPPRQETSTDNGRKMNIFTGAGAGGFCIVGFIEDTNIVDPNAQLVAGRDSFAKSVSAQVTNSKRTTFPRGTTKLPALKFDAASAKHWFRSLSMIDASGVYQVVAGVPKEGGDMELLERCIRGFKLIPKD